MPETIQESNYFHFQNRLNFSQEENLRRRLGLRSRRMPACAPNRCESPQLPFGTLPGTETGLRRPFHGIEETEAVRYTSNLEK